MKKIHPSEITPQHVYINRRQFLLGAGAVLASWALGGCACPEEPGQQPTLAAATATELLSEQQPTSGAVTATGPPQVSKETDELGNRLNSFEEVTAYNNFYEFSLSKGEVVELAKDFSAGHIPTDGIDFHWLFLSRIHSTSSTRPRIAKFLGLMERQISREQSAKMPTAGRLFLWIHFRFHTHDRPCFARAWQADVCIRLHQNL